jgi:hypothetical protein
MSGSYFGSHQLRLAKMGGTETTMAAARKTKVAGETVVHKIPAMALAARLALAWAVARRPKADPRRSSGARLATAALCAVSAQPMPIPARIKAGRG